MTISRSTTVVGWVVIAVAIVTAWIGALASRGRFPSAAALLRTSAQHVVVRVLLLAGWAWVGWHLFVHTSR